MPKSVIPDEGSIWKWIKRYLVTGILVVGPLGITIYLLVKGFLILDNILSPLISAIIRYILPFSFLEKHPIPGVGLVALLVILILVGFAARNVFGQWVIIRIQRTFNQIPLVNRVYKAVQQISEAVFSGRQEVFKNAVLIEYPRKGVYSIAIMTADTGGVVQEALPEDTLSVFLPTTPNPTSGFLLFVPKKDIIELDISVEEALKLIISGGTITTFDEIPNRIKKSIKR